MSGWTEASLFNVAKPDAPIGYGIVQVGPYDRGGVPVIAIRDLLKPSVEGVHRSSRRIESQYTRSRVTGGDVLISVKGTTGRIGLVPEGFEGNISRDVARIRLRETHDPRYWLHLLRSDEAQQRLQLAAVGTTRQELSIGTLKNVRFKYPNRAEQSRIADVLSDVDELTDSLGRSIAKRRDFKRAMALELMTGHARLLRSSQEWHTLSLDELATLNKGEQLGRVDMDPMGSVPVWNGGVEPSGFTTVPNVRRRVVTVSEGGNSCGWVGMPAGAFWLGGHCYALEPRDRRLSIAFLYQALKFRETEIMALRVGSGLPNIQKTRLREFRLEVPRSFDEATEIEQKLDVVDGEVRALEAKLHKVLAIKQGMIQRLIGGELALAVGVGS